MTTAALVVAGAHLAGQPLNHQLTDLGATFDRSTLTAPDYAFFALEGGKLPKPGLVRVAAGTGGSYEVEVWNVPVENLGRFLLLVPSPLCLGTVHLADGTAELGFLCETIATEGARDISRLNGWREYLALPRV